MKNHIKTFRLIRQAHLSGAACGLFLALFPLAESASAQNAGGFKRFAIDPNTPAGAHEIVRDPTGSAPMGMVHRFTLNAGACSNRKHVSSDASDCKFNSLRATAYEPDFRPKSDEWVSWSMYLPADFPVGRQQAAKGLYTFAYWHNTLCPHVSLVSDTGNSTTLFLQTTRADPSGRFNCIPDTRIPVTDLRNLRGKWTRFDLRTIFRADRSGGVELYLNGSRVIAQNMRTIAPGPKKTYFVFGLYLCCTTGTERITSATAYYTRLSRARSRAALK